MHIVTGRADTILVNFADISYGMDSVHAVHNKCNELWYTGFRTVMCIPDGYQRRLTPEHVLLAPQFLVTWCRGRELTCYPYFLTN